MSLLDLPAGFHVSGQGPAVVLLHSSLSSAKQWNPLVKALKECYTVINIDMLGYGQAEKVSFPQAYNFDVEATRINAALKLIIGNAPFHLVGHSCGGALALKLAVESHDKILSLSLYEPVAFHLLPQNTAERALSDEFAASVLVDDNFVAAEVFTNFWNEAGFFKSLPPRMQELMAADMPKVQLDFKGLIGESYGLSDVHKVTAPTLLMLGDNSPNLSKHLTLLIAKGLTNVHIEHFDAGHMAPISHSDAVLPTILNFITKCSNEQ